MCKRLCFTQWITFGRALECSDNSPLHVLNPQFGHPGVPIARLSLPAAQKIPLFSRKVQRRCWRLA